MTIPNAQFEKVPAHNKFQGLVTLQKKDHSTSKPNMLTVPHSMIWAIIIDRVAAP